MGEGVAERELGAAGLEMARVAEILVTCPPGAAQGSGQRGRRGSGYRVGDRYVLTAAHVVAPPVASIRVRFDADRPTERTSGARVVLGSSGPEDLAILELDAPHGAAGAVPRYADVPDEDVILPFTAVGFPRFKLRADTDPARRLDDGSPTQYRDSCHVTGTVAALSNRREGTLELVVTPPADTVEPDRSPWEGMSGALVWSGGAVIGLITAHHRTDGPNRLAAVRVGRWYETLPEADLAVLRARAGLPGRGELLPADGNGSTDGGADGGADDPAKPSLASLPYNLTFGQLQKLIDALADLRTLRRADGLESVLKDVDRRVDANRDRVTALRPALYSVLSTCLRYPGTLDQFLDALRVWEEGSVEMERVDQEAARLARDHG